MPNQRMQNLFDLVCEAVRVVQNCGRPGWLLRGACDERSVEDFIMVHSTILETLRVRTPAHTCLNNAPLSAHMDNAHDAHLARAGSHAPHAPRLTTWTA